MVPYIFRVFFAFSLSFAVTVFSINRFVIFLKKVSLVQYISSSLSNTGDHAKKQNTPTMGGIVILLSSLLSSLLFAKLNKYVWAVLLFSSAFGVIGFLDDIKKITGRNNVGLSGRKRLICEIVLALLFILIINKGQIGFFKNTLILPILSKMTIHNRVSGLNGLHLGVLLYTIFRILVITGSINSVNLTDGLDGLVSFPSLLSLLVMAFLSYSVGNGVGYYYHVIAYSPLSELAVVCVAVAGSVLGFLWHNCKPATIFMGDTGSLFIGSIIGLTAVATKSEIILFFSGGLFVMEAVSVILQIGSLRLRKKRVFLMAPFHHHFEKKNWPEVKIITRFWIMSLLFNAIAVLFMYI